MPWKNLKKLDYEVQHTKKRRGKIYRAGRLFATGEAEISKDEVRFSPKHRKSSAGLLSVPVKLITKKTEPPIFLEHTKELLDSSSEEMWFFRSVTQIGS